MKNDFLDNIIKEKLDQQQYEFSSADWNSFEKKQNSAGSSGSGLKWFLGGAAAVAAISIGVYVWLGNTSATPSTTETNEEKIEQHDLSEHSQPSDIIVHSSENPQKTNPENNIADSNSGNEQNSSNTNTFTETTETPTSDDLENKDESSSNNSEEPNTSKESTDNSIETGNDDVHNENVAAEVAVPSAVIMSGNLEICPGEVVSFETIEQPDVIYAWNLGDNTYSNDRLITHEYNQPGKYIVSLIVTSSKDRSILSKSKEVVVEVLPVPNTSFEVEYLDDQIMPSIQLISDEALQSYYWEFGDGTHATEAQPIKNFKKKGYYNITLSSTSVDGCKSSTTKKVAIEEDYNLLAPNSFTPNGDGINDFFIPEALKTMDVQFTMSIFSQSQGLIFETKNINQQWDGSNQQNGENCSEGTYIWVVSLTNSEGKSEQYKGAVLLLK